MSTLHFFDANSGTPNTLGDPEKTVKIQHLMEVPFVDRHEDWIEDFIINISECNLQLSDPEVALATDGFPYMNLKTIEPDSQFHAFVIKNELDTLLRNGFGIVINAHKGRPDWLFSCGDLLNMKLSKNFYTEESSFSKQTENTVIQPDEKILVGQPSEDILPAQTRIHIREFLEFSGIHHGKVMLIARNYENEEDIVQDLVFNIVPKQFRNIEEYQKVMNTISWFLPKHYSILGIDEMTVQSGFEAI